MLKIIFVELLLYATHAALVVGTVWRVVVRDKGQSRFIRCGLVIAVYLIATSPLAIQPIFVQGRDDSTQGTTYVYSPRWILLSSTSFMANILITNCIVIWWCWFLSGHKWMFAVIPGLCTTVGSIFAGFGLYEMTTTPSSGNTCAAQIDWMLPYYSMSLAVTMLCTLVILHRIVMDPCNRRRTRRLWIKVIVESSLLFAVGLMILLAIYIKSGMGTSCPVLDVTMCTGLVPILAIARVSSDATMQESAPFEPQDNVV
ncbi:hypothetical protein ARMSODRAFT_1018274 [Armillaria solidipes]|uniref:Uncharacterized protein n=1 Tax=Armillaria solidipes TaxID=1076256 RepID=A0A2H3BMP5_9AGAR|nr:hypothetical protein ARMSODRAFT_1018274 [Armillaria solidipes]